MKKLLLFLLMLLPALAPTIRAEVDGLYFTMKNGQHITYRLTSMPALRIEGNEMQIYTTDSDEPVATLLLADIARYEFVDIASVQPAPADIYNNIVCRGTEIDVFSDTVGEHLTAYTLSGVAVMDVMTDATGRAHMSLADMQPGIYVIKFLTTTTKILKQ